MTKEEIHKLCLEIAPKYNLDPLLIFAIIEQESSFDKSARRLEQGFFSKYSRPQNFNEVSEILLSASYGLMQLMGMSLYEMNFFPGINNEQQVAYLLKAFLDNPYLQIEYGCKWFDKKLKLANGKKEMALQYWNGGGNKNYFREVLERKEKWQTQLNKI